MTSAIESQAVGGLTITCSEQVSRRRQRSVRRVVIGGGIKSNTQTAATVRVRDVLEGPETGFGAKVVVNATGAWVDPVAETLTGRQPQAIRTTKGIHLVCKPLTQRALVLFSRLDRRLLFAILRAD